jgi:hypothetical protein
LRTPLPQADALGARAALVRELIGGTAALADLPDEAVPLGLLAMDTTGPLWLDLGLVRRPLRPPLSPDGLQQDLAAHYAELLRAILELRRGSGLNGAFAASHYFRVLPPFGPLPKDALDPEHGGQTFFPEGYEVSIAPVRRSDLPAVLRESVPLAPMDLERDLDADVMVLVPMSDRDFAWRGRQLERGAATPRDAFGLGRLLAVDRLALRLYPAPKPHAVDTDADTWRTIWADTDPDEILYVRRPPRTAETNVSALVLARGFALPALSAGLPTDAAALEQQLDTALEDLEAARAQAATLSARVEELEGATVDERITVLEAQVATLTQDLATAQAALTTLAQGLTDAQTQVGTQTAIAAQAEVARATAAAERDAVIAERDAARAAQIPSIAKLRRLDATAQAAATKLDTAIQANPEALAAVGDIAAMVERRYDSALWSSLLTIARIPANLSKLRDALAEQVNADSSAAVVFVEQGAAMRLTAAQITQWKTLVG